MRERREILIRVFIGIVSGVILAVWRYFILVLGIINWIYTLFSGKRSKDISKLCEIWNTQIYTYLRYMTLVTNQRPFPFRDLSKSISKFKR